MNNSIESRIKETLSSVFNVPVNQIKDNSSPHTIGNWDSLTHLKMVISLEEEFDIDFDDSEIESMVSLRIIIATISAYLP